MECLGLADASIGLFASVRLASDVDGSAAPPVGGICLNGHLNGCIAATGDMRRRRVDESVVINHLCRKPTAATRDTDRPIIDSSDPDVVSRLILSNLFNSRSDGEYLAGFDDWSLCDCMDLAADLDGGGALV